MNIVVFLYL